MDKRNRSLRLKKKGSSPRRPLQEILQRGTGSSGAPSRSSHATSELAAEISAKGRDERVVRIQPKAISRTLLRESAVLTHHCRELAVLEHPQNNKV
jgi:hypothetical protein